MSDEQIPNPAKYSKLKTKQQLSWHDKFKSYLLRTKICGAGRGCRKTNTENADQLKNKYFLLLVSSTFFYQENTCLPV